MKSGTLEKNYRLAFEALPGYHFLLIPDAPVYSITAVSQELLDITGLPRKSIVGKSVFSVTDFFGTLPAETVVYILKNILTTRSEYTYENNKSTDAETRTIFSRSLRISFKPILDGDQDVAFILITLVTREARPSTISVEGDGYNATQISHVLMQAPVGMAIAKGDQFVLELANEQMLKLWGKTAEIIGLPIMQALPEISNQPFPDLLRNVYESGIEYHGVETPAYIRHGSHLLLSYFNFVYSPMKDPAGNVTGIMIIATDVTSLVKARKELEESEKRYRDLIAKATVATAIYIGENMVIRLANEAMLKLWGKSPGVIGRPLREAIPELEGQPFYELLHRVYKTGITYHSGEDKASLIVDGKLQTFYFNFTYKALRDSNGKIYGILNMAVDVSDIVRARMEINDAEERWRIALQAAELGTWDFYPKTGEFYCSARTKELFGLSAHARTSLNDLLNAIHPKDRQRLQAVLDKALKKESAGHYRVDYAVTGIEDRKLRWQRSTGQVFYDDNGEPFRVTGTVLDITERKRIEEALEERVMQRTKELMQINKELERSNLELEQYAYVASHDLQEPLRKILVYADLLRNDIPVTGNGPSRLERIMASATRMSALIKDLLNFSKLMKTERLFSMVDLNKVVKNVMEDFELKIQETNAQVDLQPLPVVEASSQQMNQLFYNLISNALKFRRDHVPPVISIRASDFPDKEKQRHADLNQTLSYFCITIEDNGIGFSQKYHSQIFDIFKRLHNRSRFEGTGIGLALCRKIVRNHQGDIFAESDEGKGTKFHVLLPKSQQGS